MSRRKAALPLLSFVIACLATIGIGALGGGEVEAQAPPDVPCRQCHADTEETFTLPSGQTVSVAIPLQELDRSAHAYQTSDVYCTDCHTNKGYRYPHPTPPADDLRDYTRWVSQSCDNCHYPHNPFHPDEVSLDVLPTCVDCHGSHAIDPAEDLLTSMPANCLDCHEDRPESWAVALLAPRPGHGAGADGYIGSDRCGGCHEELYAAWQQTLHANVVRDVAEDPEAVVGDFSAEDDDLTFGLDAVDYTIGSRWKQLYVRHDSEADRFEILPTQWNVATEEWVPYHPQTGAEGDWRQRCGSCHVTGLDTETWTFEEFSVGCESCHGPGEAHAANPEEVSLFAQVDDQVCGACHSRGASPEGHPFPAGYQPGEDLTTFFTFADDEELFWPNGSARRNYMQYMDWHLVGNAMTESGEVACVTCHAVHDSGAADGQLRQPLNDLCLSCHTDKQALALHTPYHRLPSERFDFTCADCHMPLMATSAVPFDIHNHTFHQPDLQASLALGAEEMPNACTLCHDNMSAQRAFDTVRYARAVTTPAPASIFGPGPTPTPPPPPTPIPSVGEPVVDEIQMPTNTWMRYTFLTVLTLALVGIVYVFIQIFRSREPNNA